MISKAAREYRPALDFFAKPRQVETPEMDRQPQLQAAPVPSAFLLESDEGFARTILTLCQSVSLAARHYAAPDGFWRDVSPQSRGCVVSNIWLPGTTGLQVQEAMLARRICLPIIFISAHPDVRTAVESLKRGAFDFLEKPPSHEVLLEAILRAVKLDAAQSVERERIQAIRGRLSQLSRREREVLNLLVRGKTAREAAAELGLSAKTVENHRCRIMEKTGAEAFAVLVRDVWEAAGGDLLSLEGASW